ncbi:MAG: Ig-like domain-containing protein [Candidatus Hydrothermia bacterium]
MKKEILLALAVTFLSCGYKAPPPGKPDWNPPSVKILSPRDGDTIREDTPVQVFLQDESRIVKVILIVSGKPVLQDSVEPFELTLFADSIKDTLAEIKVRAFDVWDNMGESAPVKVFKFLPQEESNDGQKKGIETEKE